MDPITEYLRHWAFLFAKFLQHNEVRYTGDIPMNSEGEESYVAEVIADPMNTMLDQQRLASGISAAAEYEVICQEMGIDEMLEENKLRIHNAALEAVPIFDVPTPPSTNGV